MDFADRRDGVVVVVSVNFLAVAGCCNCCGCCGKAVAVAVVVIVVMVVVRTRAAKGDRE